MAEAQVRGVALTYEIIGDHGSWIALTPGSRRSYDEFVPLAKQLAKQGYRVLLHDRRNCGRSEVGIEARGSEHEIWADDLNELCRQIGANEVYAGGASAGARLALLFALRHPSTVKALLLWRVTGGQHAAQKLAQQYYGSFIEMANAGGMAAVCASEHFGECIKARPLKSRSADGDDAAGFHCRDEYLARELPAGSRSARRGRNRGPVTGLERFLFALFAATTKSIRLPRRAKRQL